MASQQIDLSRLKTTLLTSGLQQRDNPLFQVIDQLIRAVEQNLTNLSSTVSSTVSNVTVLSSKEWSVLTDGNLLEPELIYALGQVIMIHVP